MAKFICNTLFIVLAISLIGIAGCKKSSSLNETWTWKGATYTAGSCTTAQSGAAGFGNSTTLSVADGQNVLNIIFNGSLPAKSCVDTVESWGNAANSNEVTLSLGTGTATYQSTGGNGNQTINVTVSGGNVTVSAPQGAPVELINIASGSVDSSGISFSIVE